MAYLPGSGARGTVQADESRNQVPSGTITTALGMCPFFPTAFVSADNGDCVVSDFLLAAGIQRAQLIAALRSTPLPPES